MKKFILLILLNFSALIGFCQTSTITLAFAGEDSQTQSSVDLNSVIIENLTLGCDTTIYGSNPSIVLLNSTGIDESPSGASGTFSLIPNFPNPFNGSTSLNIKVVKQETLTLSLSDARGEKIAGCQHEFPAGVHKFVISSFISHLLILNISDGNTSESIKLINLTSGLGGNAIKYIGMETQNSSSPYKPGKTSGFIYHLGDQLSFFGIADGYNVENITGAPLHNTSYTFQLFPQPVSDGYYVTGTATAYSVVNDKAMMKTAINEIFQTTRPWLKELYIPIKAGSGGFNIVKVTGAIQKPLGPSDDFTEVTPAVDEPKLGLQRGHYADTTGKFMVSSDGLYHVIIDVLLGKVAISKVSWEIIGAATPGGWLNDTEMTETPFNLTTMSWTITNQQLTAGDWRFRYSHGWKVIMDTTPGDPVSVNANLGGFVYDLLAGGANFINVNPGIYTCFLSYTLGSGYTATLTQTGNISVPENRTFK